MSENKPAATAPPALRFTMKSLDGKNVPLSKYQGKVVLIVNVASECGLTPQYEQLQALHKQYASQGLAVIGVPCNQFGMQEPGSSDEIQQFCQQNYGVSFDLMAKVDVNGQNAAELFQYLKKADTKPKGPGEISWNFEKFVLNRQGEVVARFDPQTEPTDPALVKVLETELAKK